MKEVGIKPHLIVESRGGFHVVLHNTMSFGGEDSTKHSRGQMNHRLYQFAQENKDWMTIERNPLIVIPGTFQGGFLTKLVNWGDEE